MNAISATGSHRSSRRSLARGIAGGALLGATALSVRVASATARQAPIAEHQVYFGWALGSPNVIAVAFDVQPGTEANTVDVRGYVCDGLGLPDGLAVWFKETVSTPTIDKRGSSATLTAVAGTETLTIGLLDVHSVVGSFTDAKGTTLKYFASPATGGAGIYDVTLDDTLHYQGTSTFGDTLAAEADRTGNVTGTITTTNGETLAFAISALSLLDPAALAASGLPATYTDYADVSVIPDSYIALISPGGTIWLGRSGDVRTGSPGTNIIGLDACE